MKTTLTPALLQLLVSLHGSFRYGVYFNRQSLLEVNDEYGSR